MSTPKLAPVTGASSGFGAMAVRAIEGRGTTPAPDDADPSEVARQIVKVVDMPKSSRPFRVYIDPADDGAEDVFQVGDRVRQWFISGSASLTCSA